MPDSTPSRTAGLLATARLSLGDATPSISTADHLRFQLDHALARDAVHTPLDIASLQRDLTARGLASITIQTNAPDRATYLRRPDLGRTLHPDSITQLKESVILSDASPSPVISTEAKRSGETPVFQTSDDLSATSPTRITLILADGLSSLALEHHALPLLDALLPLLSSPPSLVPILTNARVAIADQIGQLLHSDLTLILIGERPGLTSPDSLGAYITWSPRPGRTDADRNCISNIRGDVGLSYTEAAHRIAHYLREAHRLQTTGTTLKDPSTPLLGMPSI